MGFFRPAASGPPPPRTLNEAAGIAPTDRPEKTEVPRPSPRSHDDHAELSRRRFHVQLSQERAPSGNGVLPTVLRRREARQMLHQERSEHSGFPTKRNERRDRKMVSCASSGSCDADRAPKNTECGALWTAATMEEREQRGSDALPSERRRLKQEKMEQERMERAWSEYDRTARAPKCTEYGTLQTAHTMEEVPSRWADDKVRWVTPADDDEGGDDRTHPEERRPRTNFCTRLGSIDTDRVPNKTDLYVRDREYFKLQTAHTMEAVASRWADDRQSERRRLKKGADGVTGEQGAPILPAAPTTEEVAPRWADDRSEQEATPTTMTMSPADQYEAAHSAVCAPSLATTGCPGVWDLFLIAVERTDGPTTGKEQEDTGTAGTTGEEQDHGDDHTGQVSEGGGGTVDAGASGTAAARTVPPARTPSRHGAPAGHHNVRQPTNGSGAAPTQYAPRAPLVHAGRLKTRSSVTRDRRRVQHNLEELEAMARHGREEIERHMRATVAQRVSPCGTQ